MNEKNLDLNCQIIEKLDAFVYWKKRRGRRYLKCGIFTLFVEIIVCILVFSLSLADISVPDLIFGIVGLIGFMLLIVFCFYRWIKCSSVIIKKFFYGTVVEKSRYSGIGKNKRLDNKAYYIIAQIDGKRIIGKCEYEIYKCLHIGHPVLMFNVGTNEWYALNI